MPVTLKTWTTAFSEERSAWRAEFVDAQGRKRSHEGFASEGHAVAWEAAERLRLDLATRRLPPAPEALSGVLEAWLERARLGDGRRPVSKTTLRTYQDTVERDLAPVLGDLRLDQITPEVMAERVTLLRGRTPAGMAKLALQRLEGAIGLAMERGWLVTNPLAAMPEVVLSSHVTAAERVLLRRGPQKKRKGPLLDSSDVSPSRQP